MLTAPIEAGPISPEQTRSGELSYAVPNSIQNPVFQFNEPNVNLSGSMVINIR
jgi:hypothetical protein